MGSKILFYVMIVLCTEQISHYSSKYNIGNTLKSYYSSDRVYGVCALYY